MIVHSLPKANGGVATRRSRNSRSRSIGDDLGPIHVGSRRKCIARDSLFGGSRRLIFHWGAGDLLLNLLFYDGCLLLHRLLGLVDLVLFALFFLGCKRNKWRKRLLVLIYLVDFPRRREFVLSLYVRSSALAGAALPSRISRWRSSSSGLHPPRAIEHCPPGWLRTREVVFPASTK